MDIFFCFFILNFWIFNSSSSSSYYYYIFFFCCFLTVASLSVVIGKPTCEVLSIWGIICLILKHIVIGIELASSFIKKYLICNWTNIVFYTSVSDLFVVCRFLRDNRWHCRAIRSGYQLIVMIWTIDRTIMFYCLTVSDLHCIRTGLTFGRRHLF